MTNAEARFIKSHIRKVYACLAVTCHLHFWQNDRDFLRATVVTRGWNGYRNKSQHRKSTLEKKILPPFQQGFEPATFQSRVRRSNHWAIPAPYEWSEFRFKFRPLRVYVCLCMLIYTYAQAHSEYRFPALLTQCLEFDVQVNLKFMCKALHFQFLGVVCCFPSRTSHFHRLTVV